MKVTVSEKRAGTLWQEVGRRCMVFLVCSVVSLSLCVELGVYAFPSRTLLSWCFTDDLISKAPSLSSCFLSSYCSSSSQFMVRQWSSAKSPTFSHFSALQTRTPTQHTTTFKHKMSPRRPVLIACRPALSTKGTSANATRGSLMSHR